MQHWKRKKQKVKKKNEKKLTKRSTGFQGDEILEQEGQMLEMGHNMFSANTTALGEVATK